MSLLTEVGMLHKETQALVGKCMLLNEVLIKCIYFNRTMEEPEKELFFIKGLQSDVLPK